MSVCDECHRSTPDDEPNTRSAIMGAQERPPRCANSRGSGHHLYGGSDMAEPIRRPRRYATCSECGDREALIWKGTAVCVVCRLHALTVVTATGCLEYQGGLTSSGYGQMSVNGRMVQTHRLAYELAVGPVVAPLVIDHLCRNRKCCNPFHMEPVSRRVNTLRGDGLAAQNARKTHCPEGHPYSGANLRIDSSGKRRCRACGMRRAA